jgi:hypothetical protein
MTVTRSLSAAITALLVALVVGLNASPAQASGFSPMKIWHSSHCLDNATEDSEKLQMWSCSGAQEQNWSASLNGNGTYSFSNQRTGRCITAPIPTDRPATMQDCDSGQLTQQWLRYASGNTSGQSSDQYFVWQNMDTKLCLTTPSVGNGTLARTTICDTSDRYDFWNKAFL